MRLTRHDPFGQCAACSASGGNTYGVESGADEEVLELRRLAEDELVVGGKRLGAVVEHLDPGLLQSRNSMQGALHQDREVIPVLLEQLEFERVRNLVGGDPWLGLGLEATDDKAADFFLHIRVAIGVAQDRHHAMHALDLLGHHVEVLGRVQGNIHPAHRADRLGPLTGAVHDDLSLDIAGIGLHAGDDAVLGRDAENARALEHLGAAHAGTLGKRLGDIGGVGRAVIRQPDSALNIADVQDGIELLGALGRDDLAFEVVGLGSRCGAQ